MEDTAVLVGTRAVERLVQAGDGGECAWEGCPEPGRRIKFAARRTTTQVLCNVYEGDRWDRIEQFHSRCYTKAGKPYGPIVDRNLRRRS